MDWRHRSECLEEDPELFFPIGNTGPAILQIEEAKQVCRRCEVREQCLAWALEAGQDTACGAASARTSGAPSSGATPALACAPRPDRRPDGKSNN